MTKIENIEDLKRKAENEVQETATETTELNDFLNVEQRNEVVRLMDKFMGENDLNMVQGLLGCVDLFSTIFATMLEENFTTTDEKAASQARFDDLRKNLTDVLNDGQRKGTYMPETLLALLGLIGESMGIVLSNSDLEEKATQE